MKMRELGTKKPVNLLVSERLVVAAKENKLNMSAILDTALRLELAKRWREENSPAFEANRKRVEEDGLWCDELRTW